MIHPAGSRELAPAVAGFSPRRSTRKVTAWIALLLLGSVAVALPAHAASVRLEAEQFDLGRSHDGGGNPFQVVNCSSASGGMALEGLDLPGDSVEFDFPVDTQACFVDSLRCAGPPGLNWQFQLELFPEGSVEPVKTIDHPELAGRGVT